MSLASRRAANQRFMRYKTKLYRLPEPLDVVPSENLVITSMTYLQPVINDWGDVRTLSNLRIASSVTDALALTVSFDLRYDSGPPDGVSALDTSLRTGLRYIY